MLPFVIVSVGELLKDDVYRDGEFGPQSTRAIDGIRTNVFACNANLIIKTVTTYVVTTSTDFEKSRFHESWLQFPIFVQCSDDSESPLVHTCQRWDYVDRENLCEAVGKCLKFRRDSALLYANMCRLNKMQETLQLRGPDALFAHTTNSVGSVQRSSAGLKWSWSPQYRLGGFAGINYTEIKLPATAGTPQPDVVVQGVTWDERFQDEAEVDRLMPQMPGVCYLVLIGVTTDDGPEFPRGMFANQHLSFAQSQVHNRETIAGDVACAFHEPDSIKTQVNKLLAQYLVRSNPSRLSADSVFGPSQPVVDMDALDELLDRVSEQVLNVQTQLAVK
jgi:hypothetical protein